MINIKPFLKIFLVIFFINFMSCKDNSANSISNTSLLNKNSLKLVEQETINFHLDEETNYNSITKLNKTYGEVYLSFFNANNFSIYIYNYDSKSLHKKIELDEDGPNGIQLGGQLQPSYFIHTLDSIFLTGSINHYLLDGNGKVLIKGSINASTSEMMSVEDKKLSFDKATYFNNGNLYTGITTYKLNAISTELRAVVPLPFDTVADTYLRKDILIENYDEVSRLKKELFNEDRIAAVMGLSFARNKQYLFASTPISDDVSIFENGKLIKKVNTGTDVIKMPDARGYFDQFRIKTYQKAMEYPFYKGIFTDIDENINKLYRIVSKGNNVVYNEINQQYEKQSKGAYLIVIDLDSNTINYIDLPTDAISLNNCFVVNNKIHFKSKSQDKENEMVFKTFKID